jgi:hypothetical protein
MELHAIHLGMSVHVCFAFYRTRPCRTEMVVVTVEIRFNVHLFKVTYRSILQDKMFTHLSPLFVIYHTYVTIIIKF